MKPTQEEIERMAREQGEGCNRASEKRKMAEKILNTLKRQKFADWYGDDFVDFISDVPPHAPTKEEVIADIIELFDL